MTMEIESEREAILRAMVAFLWEARAGLPDAMLEFLEDFRDDLEAGVTIDYADRERELVGLSALFGLFELIEEA
jgi:hypothetical protein